MVVVLAVEVAEGSRGARARVEARARVGMLVAELVVEVAEGGSPEAHPPLLRGLSLSVPAEGTA